MAGGVDMANIYDIDGNVLYRDSNQWANKKIWWCGTSIPAGHDQSSGLPISGLSYPELVAQLLGATVYNVSLGSSMIRANTRTGDYAGGVASSILYSLSQTIDEKEDIISNWSTIKQVLAVVSGYETLTEGIQNTALSSSFENRLLPYLDGTNDMPDLFVIDHGHNDGNVNYSMPNPEGAGTISDMEIEPTLESISSQLLAEDTYMTANSKANLISFYGSLGSIHSADLNAFVASVNRNCFIGAVNFICTLILKYNPRARIVFIGNLDSWERPHVWKAQEKAAASWEFPIIKMWEYTGFSEHYVPGTEHFWANTGTKAFKMKQIYCKDGIHPMTDTTGRSLQVYANTIANALRNII